MNREPSTNPSWLNGEDSHLVTLRLSDVDVEDLEDIAEDFAEASLTCGDPFVYSKRGVVYVALEVSCPRFEDARSLALDVASDAGYEARIIPNPED